MARTLGTNGTHVALLKRFTVRREHFGAVVFDADTAAYFLAKEWVGDWLLSAKGFSTYCQESGIDNARRDLASKEMTDLGLSPTSFTPSAIKRIETVPVEGGLCAPLRVYIDTTYACNLKCAFCYDKIAVKREPQMPLALWLSFLEEMASNGVMKLSIAGGEPLMDAHVFKIIAAASALGLVVSMTTNGTLIRDREIGLLRDSHLKRLTVSVDGYDQQTSEARRPGICFDGLVAALHRLMDETDLDIALKCTFTVDTSADWLNRIILLADQLGASAIKFNFERDMASSCRTASREESIRYFTLWRSLLASAKSAKTRVICNQRNPVVLNGPLMSNVVGWGCPAGRDLMYMNPYGEVKGCALLSEDFVAGRYPTADLAEIWRGGKGIVQLRSSVINEKCRDCEFLTVCRGGCTQRRVLHGGLDQPDYYCFLDVADAFPGVKPAPESRNRFIERYDLAHL